MHSSLVVIKHVVLKPVIRFFLRHPEKMHSRWFIWVMRIFPDRMSERYDHALAISREALQAGMHELITYMPQKPNLILDVCTGTGAVALILAHELPQAVIHGVDISLRMLDKARKKAESNQVTNIVWQREDAQKLSYRDNSFDLVVTANAPVYIDELARVVRERGNLCIWFSFSAEVFTESVEEMRTLLASYQMKLVRIMVRDNQVGLVAEKLSIPNSDVYPERDSNA